MCYNYMLATLTPFQPPCWSSPRGLAAKRASDLGAIAGTAPLHLRDALGEQRHRSTTAQVPISVMSMCMHTFV